MTSFDHFNLLSPLYDFIFGRSEDHEIVQLADMSEGQSLLDVGGGTGRVSVLFKKFSGQIVVADSALKMLQKARAKVIPVVNTQSEHLPFNQGVFDRVLMVDALHHVEDQKASLQEMWRVLAPGGRLIIEEPDINNLFVKLIALFEKLLLMRSHFLSPDEISELCRFDGSAVVDLHRKKGIVWFIITRVAKE